MKSLQVVALGVWLVSAMVAAGPDRPGLEVRLQNHLTSYSSAPGTAFRCIVIRAYALNGHVLIPKGSEVYGSVVRRRGVGMGIVHERAGLDLGFHEFETPDGRRHPLHARLASIDNAREQVTPKGAVKGVLAASNPGNLLNGFWTRPTSSLLFRGLIGLSGASNQMWVKLSGGPISAAALFTARCLIFPFPEPEIHLPPGTDMTLQVTADPPSSEALPTLVNVADVHTETAPAAYGELSDWLGTKLSRLTFHQGQLAPDLMNVAVVGSRQEVTAAFVTAGWSTADRRTLRTSSHVFQAFSEKTEYAAAPVSEILYHGAAPDLVFEKSFDTVTQRHHIRLWRAGQFEGREVWLGAATHDTGVSFRLRSLKFTHTIDRDIDLEREKVSTDLTFSGCSETPALFDGEAFSAIYRDGRPHPELAAFNQLHAPLAEDDKSRTTPTQSSGVITDGQIVVLPVHPCAADQSNEAEPPRPGNRFTRLTRRVVLEARNYVLRDNTYYWGYRMLRNRSLAKSIPE